MLYFRRSLIILYGQARYDWEHSILRQHITERRVCIAYREFTPLYLEGGIHSPEGLEILKKSKNFWQHEVSNKRTS